MTAGSGSIRVLYIEDQQEQRESLTKAMESRGFRVTTAVSGETGVAMFRPGRFDIVLCDLNMPGMDGIEVLKAVRPCCPDTPFVLLTAHGTISQAVDAIKQGAQRFVLKPVTIGAVEITIHQAIEHAQVLNRLKDSENHVRMILDNVPDMIFSLNRDAEFVDVSPSVKNILGYEPEECLGRRPLDFALPEDREAVEADLADVLKRGHGDRVTSLLRIVAKDGSVRMIETSRRIVFDSGGRPERIDGVARDVTERVRMEQELESYRRDLESRVAERTERLAFANRQLAALNDAATKLAVTLDEQELMQSIPRLLTETLDFDRAGFFVQIDGRLELVNFEFRDLDTEEVRDLFQAVESQRQTLPPHFARALQENRTIHVPNLAADPTWPAQVAKTLRVNSAVVTPVRVKDKPIGILVANMEPTGRPMDEHDIARVETFASLVGLGIDNVRNYQQMERQVQERTASLHTANEELRAKARELERSALELGKANVELLITQEALEDKQTQLERLLDQLEKGRDQLQAILDSADSPVLLVGLDDRVASVNKAVKSTFGLEPEAVVGMPFEKFIDRVAPSFEKPEAFREWLKSPSSKIEYLKSNDKHSTKIFDYTLTQGDAERDLLILSFAVIDSHGDPIGRGWMFEDVSDLKRADERLQTIMRASPVPLIVSRFEDGHVIYANDHLAKLVGYGTEDLVGRRTPDFYWDPADREAIIEVLRRDGAIDNHELRIKRKDGSVRWCLVSLVATTLVKERVIIGGFYDISQRRAAEEALRLSETRFRGLVENSRAIICSIDGTGVFTYISPSVKDILGWEMDDFVGKPVTELLHPEDVPVAESWMEDGFVDPTQEKGWDFRMRHREGHYLWFSSDETVVHDDEGNVSEIIAAAHDITYIKKVNNELAEAYYNLQQTQSQLIQSEKMASLGMLVAGIAHEINTPIGAVNSMHDTLTRAYSRLKSEIESRCAHDCTLSERMTPLLTAIDNANAVIQTGTARVTEIVKRLRSFARLDEAELKTVDIHEGIEDTLALVHHEIKNRITVERKYGDIRPVACFPGRLNQVFLNLLNNARQAIDDKGTITIATRIERGMLRIDFSDDGRGISEEHLKRIFDPGFTTKGVGVGTGLGLSICYTILEEHHGRIEVASKPGEGTTFTLWIPLNLDELVENGR